jgi:hypothetical protein
LNDQELGIIPLSGVVRLWFARSIVMNLGSNPRALGMEVKTKGYGSIPQVCTERSFLPFI